MAVVKAISTQELAALANRLRLTLIRDRMEEMLTMAPDCAWIISGITRRQQ